MARMPTEPQTQHQNRDHTGDRAERAIHRQLGTPESTLRLVLRANAATSGLGGLTALLAGGATAELLGTGDTTWVRIVGAGLVAFAVFVAVIASSSTKRLRQEVPVISAGDLAWVVGTIATIALGWYSTRGALAMGAVGAMVGAFAVTQARFVRRLGSDDRVSDR